MKTFKAVCVFEQFIKIGGTTPVLVFQIEILNLIRKGNYIMKLSQIFSFWKSKILIKLLRFQTQMKTFKADNVFEQLVEITPVNISGFVQMDNSLVINWTKNFFGKFEKSGFLDFENFRILTTRQTWMKTLKAVCVFQQFIKIGGYRGVVVFQIEALNVIKRGDCFMT